MTTAKQAADILRIASTLDEETITAGYAETYPQSAINSGNMPAASAVQRVMTRLAAESDIEELGFGEGGLVIACRREGIALHSPSFRDVVRVNDNDGRVFLDFSALREKAAQFRDGGRGVAE